MHLTADQLENVIGSILEHGEGRKGFMRVNLDQISGCHITVHKDGDDVLISSYDDGVKVTDRFPVLKGMGS